MNRVVPLAAALAAALTVVAAAPAVAATTFTVACANTGALRQVVREGTGTREQMQGIGTVALYCPANKQIQSHRIGLEGDAFERLKAIAAIPASDEVAVASKVDWTDADTAGGEATRNAIGWNREKTFGQLREMLAKLTAPTGEFVGDTGFRTYRSERCPEPLVPIRYYLKTKQPFPACDGGLLIQEGAETTTMD